MPLGTSTAIAAGTAALGAFGGSKGGSQTVAQRPYMPKEYEKGYDKLLEDALKLVDRPRYDVPTARYAPNTSDPIQKMLFSPELAMLQGGEDAKYIASITGEQPAQPAAQDATAQQDAMKKMQLEMAAQAWLSQQMAQQMPGTRKMQQLQGVKNMSGLGEMLAAYEQGTGGKAMRLDDLSRFTDGKADLYETYRGIYA